MTVDGQHWKGHLLTPVAVIVPVAMIVQHARTQGNAGWIKLTSLDRECDRRYVQNLCYFDGSLWLRLHVQTQVRRPHVM